MSPLVIQRLVDNSKGSARVYSCMPKPESCLLLLTKECSRLLIGDRGGSQLVGVVRRACGSPGRRCCAASPAGPPTQDRRGGNHRQTYIHCGDSAVAEANHGQPVYVYICSAGRQQNLPCQNKQAVPHPSETESRRCGPT